MNRLVLICTPSNIYGLAYKTLRFIQTTLSFPLIIGLDDFCFQVLLFLSLLSCFSLFSCWSLMWRKKKKFYMETNLTSKMQSIALPLITHRYYGLNISYHSVNVVNSEIPMMKFPSVSLYQNIKVYWF